MIRYVRKDASAIEKWNAGLFTDPGFFYSGGDVFVLGEKGKGLAVLSSHLCEQEALAHIRIVEGLSEDALLHTVQAAGECLWRAYHCSHILFEDVKDPALIHTLNVCRYYARGRRYMKIVEPWRIWLSDSAFDYEGYFIDQEKAEQLPFGYFSTKDKGCGWIAAWNLLRLNGMEKEMQWTAESLAKTSLLGEVFGQSVSMLYFWLRKQGLNCYPAMTLDKLTVTALNHSSSGILLYFHATGNHFVTYRFLGRNQVQIYNANGRMDQVDSPEHFLATYNVFPFATVLFVQQERNE